jgi:hypothetical protein
MMTEISKEEALATIGRPDYVECPTLVVHLLYPNGEHRYYRTDDAEVGKVSKWMVQEALKHPGLKIVGDPS